MGGRLHCVTLLFLGGLAACETTTAPQGRDLAKERGLYTPTGFKAQLPGQLTAFLDTVADERGPLPQVVEGIYKPQYLGDGVFARPVPNMVRDLLLEELEASLIFKSVVDSADRADVVVQPSLIHFYASIEERIAGRRMRAKSAIKLRVFGPKDASGTRAKVFEQVYESNEVQKDGLGFTNNLLVDQGNTLRVSMSRMLRDLDGKRIGRELSAVEAAASKPADQTK
jgi:hypothetical protein